MERRMVGAGFASRPATGTTRGERPRRRPGAAAQLPDRSGCDSLADRRAAEQALLAAAQRYREIRFSGSTPQVPPTSGSRWPRLAGTVVGVGALLGGMTVGFLVTAYFKPGPAIVLPAAAALGALIAVTVILRPRYRRPVVADLVEAEIELRRAEAALRRMRDRTTAPSQPPSATPPKVRPAIPPDVRRLVEAAARGFQPERTRPRRGTGAPR